MNIAYDVESGSKQLSEVFKAIVDVIKAVPDLTKSNRNNFGKYNYVSIDDYYEHISLVAASHGLSWVASEDGFETIEAKSGDGTKLAVFKYSFTLLHVGGRVLHNVAKITIVHPIQGAQTSGSALSYAEKCFMRMMFKVRTGELDADATDPSMKSSNSDMSKVFGAPRKQPSKPTFEKIKEVETAQAPVAAEAPVVEGEAAKFAEHEYYEGWSDDDIPIIKRSTTEVKIILEAVKEFLPLAETLDGLRKFKEANKPLFDMAKEQDSEAYKIINRLILSKAEELKKNGK